MVPGSLTEDGAVALLDSNTSDEPLIRLENIHVSYPVAGGEPKKVLDGIDLTFECGQFVSVVGRTGCGKSTLLRLVLGAEMPTSGRVIVSGREVRRPDRDRGYVPQKYSLFPDKTVIGNITFGLEVEEFSLLTSLTPRFFQRRREFREEALRQLRHMGLQDSDAGKYPDQLSGGMQQRVAIAQALVMKPKVLLMDEAFSALDPGTRAAMQKLIRRVWKETKTTVLFVTHNIDEAVRLGTRVIVLAKECAADAEGSRVALDVAVPDAEERVSKARFAEEIAEVVRRVEEATGHLRAEEEVE
jgi:NitT/TauT family transport system ATP-binding protein